MTATTATRSCVDCPSYLESGQVIDAFGKSVSAPMCKRYGKVLGQPNSTNPGRTPELIAKNCPSFGRVAPSTPEEFSPVVALPDPTAISEKMDDLDPAKRRITSCATCKWFVKDEIVAEEWGWSAGLCSAKGRLILSNKRVAEANGCDLRAFGVDNTGVNVQRRDVLGINLLPEYNDSIMGSRAAVTTPSAPSWVEPHEYPTDAPVSPEEAAEGIRAWRKFADPDDPKNEDHWILAPVFDPNYFPKDQQALIPRTGDDSHPELYIDHNHAVYRILTLWLGLDETPACWGIPGVGKTEVYRHLAWLMCLPFHRVSITGSTELDDLAGKMLFKDGETTFRYGRVTKAWISKCVMCIDEPNTGQPEVWEWIRPMTDNSKQLVIDQGEDPVPLTRSDFTFLGLAMNPAWSPINIGANPIGDADSSRLMHISFGYPPEAVERQIISDRVKLDGWVIDTKRLDYVMSVAKKIRQSTEEGSLQLTFATRSTIQVARALRWYSNPLTAFRMAVADMLEPDQAQIVLDHAKADMRPFGAIQKLED